MTREEFVKMQRTASHRGTHVYNQQTKTYYIVKREENTVDDKVKCWIVGSSPKKSRMIKLSSLRLPTFDRTQAPYFINQ